MKELFAWKRVWWGLGLLCLLAVCRIPWLSCDGGVLALWDYGYFCTDEGAYTLEGRYLYLTGKIFNPLLMGSGTFTVANLQHLLCFLSYKCFGLNDWAHRVPVLVVSISAWMGVYIFLSRRTAVWLAALAVGIVSCNPLCLVYERTASSDVLMGGLAVLAFVFAWRRSLWSVVLSAAFLALAYNAKVSALGIVPLIGLIVVSARDQRWRRGVLFAATLIVLVWGSHYLLNAYINHLAILERMAPGEMIRILRRVGSTPGLPELVPALKSFSVFPRWTTAGVLGAGVAFAMAIPFLALIGRLLGKVVRWDRNVAIYLGLIIFMAAVDLGRGQFYVRHYLFLFYFIPIMIVLIRKDIPKIRSISWRQTLCFLGISFLAFEAIFWLVPLGCSDPSMLSPYFCIHHNPPLANAWLISWRVIVPAAIMMLIVAGSLQKGRGLSLKWWGMAIGISLVIAHFGSTGWSVFRFGFAEALAKVNLVPLILLHLLLIGLGTIWLLPWAGLRRWKSWYACFMLAFIAAWLINPYWRDGTVQLLSRKWERRNIATALENCLPDNAVVIGDLTAGLLMGSRLNTVYYIHISDEEMINQYERLIRSNKVLFVLLDKNENQHWQALARNATRIQFAIIATIKLPARHNGELMDFYLARLECVKK